MTQAFEAEPGNPMELMRLPFIIQMATTPLVVLRQMTSALPSPVISPIPAICQLSGTPPGKATEVRTVPFISQMAVLPVLVLRHTKSAFPSPLRSYGVLVGNMMGGGTGPLLVSVPV